MIRRCDLVAVLICIFYYCNAHLIIFTCNLRTISIKLLLLYYICFSLVQEGREFCLWRGIMDKNVLRSFCVVHYIVPASDVPGDAIYYQVCCYIAPDMSLYRTAHRTLCCYIVLSDAILYRSCYYIVPYVAISYRSCYYIVPYAAISYTVMLCRTAHAITSYRMLLYRIW